MTGPQALATLDTNIAIYAFTDRGNKAGLALQVLRRVNFVSVQLLNEFANVTNRKYGFGWSEVIAKIADIRLAVPRVLAIDAAANTEAIRIATRYRLSFYDSLMLANALSGGARAFYSEDMQHDLVIDDTLRIVDPFRPGAPAL